MPYTPPPIPSGYRRLEEYEVVPLNALYDACGFGEFIPTDSYLGQVIGPNRVAFITKLSFTALGNKITEEL